MINRQLWGAIDLRSSVNNDLLDIIGVQPMYCRSMVVDYNIT